MKVRMQRLSLLIVASLSSFLLPAFAQARPSGSASVSVRAFAGSGLVYPLMAPRISSEFGLRKHPIRKVVRDHDGIDLAAPMGAPVRAVADGVVIFADPYAGYGNLVVVLHKAGITTHYGHLSKIEVAPGKRIKAGQIIGKVGSTGISTGPHLHWEVRVNGEAVDPEVVMPDLTQHADG